MSAPIALTPHTDDIGQAFDECRAALGIAASAPAPPPGWYGRRAATAVPLTGVGLRCLASYLASINPHHHREA